MRTVDLAQRHVGIVCVRRALIGDRDAAPAAQDAHDPLAADASHPDSRLHAERREMAEQHVAYRGTGVFDGEQEGLVAQVRPSHALTFGERMGSRKRDQDALPPESRAAQP